MIGSMLDRYRQTLACYSQDLLAATAERVTRFSRSKKPAPPLERIENALANQRTATRLWGELDPAEQKALALFMGCPSVYWRWDHAIRLLVACGIDSPYPVLQVLLTEGLLCMRSAGSGDPLARFHVSDGLPRGALPAVGVSAPLVDAEIEVPHTVDPLTGHAGERWRHADGWELPLRLAILWRLAWSIPIRRTQQGQLFKRDQERIAESPLLTAPLLDAPAELSDTGTFTYELALKQGWLGGARDEQSPTGPLREIWPEDLHDLLMECGRDALMIDGWNELGAETPVGSFAEEAPSARFLLLLWLGSLEGDQGAEIDDLANRLMGAHPPWHGSGERVGPFRLPDQRAELARRWTRRCLLGPLYQCGLIEVDQARAGRTLVRLSPLGRRFLGEPVEPPPPVVFPKTLLVQPNHEAIVYRQGLLVPLLADLVLFAEPMSLGAALTFGINADSVYSALEAGMSAERIIGLLTEHGGRDLPSGLAESIRTWAQKRDRISVYADAALLEFNDASDLDDALARGAEGVPLTDRLLLVPTVGGPNFKNLRITASRDYRFGSEPCVETGSDGVTLKIDITKSDLMLESELLRFAECVSDSNPQGSRVFRVTRRSLGRAIEQGLDGNHLEEWYRARTGAPPPASIHLLQRAVGGADVRAVDRIVLTVETPSLADGLLQHPATAQLFGARLGPCALAVPRDKLDVLQATLGELGIELKLDDD